MSFRQSSDVGAGRSRTRSLLQKENLVIARFCWTLVPVANVCGFILIVHQDILVVAIALLVNIIRPPTIVFSRYAKAYRISSVLLSRDSLKGGRRCLLPLARVSLARLLWYSHFHTRPVGHLALSLVALGFVYRPLAYLFHRQFVWELIGFGALLLLSRKGRWRLLATLNEFIKARWGALF